MRIVRFRRDGRIRAEFQQLDLSHPDLSRRGLRHGEVDDAGGEGIVRECGRVFILNPNAVLQQRNRRLRPHGWSD